MKAVRFDELYELEMPERITRQGMNEVREYLSHFGYYDHLPVWFSPSWVNSQVDQEGATINTVVDGQSTVVPVKYHGKFPNRVEQWIRQRGWPKLTAEEKSAIGDIVSRHRMQAGPVYFDFTNHFNWNAGDFGDCGSCFWGGNAEARPALQAAGAFAIRIYDPACAGDLKAGYRSGLGIGRAWIVPQGDYHILFNGYMDHRLYGRSHTDDITFVLGQLYAMFMQEEYRLIELCNFGDTGGTIYINGGRGMAIGPADVLEYIHRVDLEIEIDDDMTVCHECGDECEDNHYTMHNGHTICGYCYEQSAGTCEWCEEIFWDDDLTPVGDAYYCNRCLARQCTLCPECHTWYPNDEVREVQGDYLCDSCFEAVTGDCSDCGKRFYSGNLVEAKDGRLFCEDCWEEQEIELEEEPVSEPEVVKTPCLEQMSFVFRQAGVEGGPTVEVNRYELPF
jgi:hypothetical protein